MWLLGTRSGRVVRTRSDAPDGIVAPLPDRRTMAAALPEPPSGRHPESTIHGDLSSR